MRRIVYWALAITGLLSSPTLFAQDDWYEVELLIYTQPSLGVSEREPQYAGLPEVEKAVRLRPETESNRVDAFTRVSKDRWNLLDTNRQLVYSQGYSILYHERWRQPISKTSHLIPLRIQGGVYTDLSKPYEPQSLYHRLTDQSEPSVFPNFDGYWLPPHPWTLEGTLSIRRSRYLHADLDLLLQSEDGSLVRNRQSRRLRTSELHYLDHPLVGALLRITPAV